MASQNRSVEFSLSGMDDLPGFAESAAETNFAKILNDRKETGGELFGFNMQELAQQADDLMSSRAPNLGERVAEPSTRFCFVFQMVWHGQCHWLARAVHLKICHCNSVH
jgi:hypothetical protein